MKKKKSLKSLFCPNCGGFPSIIIEQYTQPIEEVMKWNEKTEDYELESSNIDGVEFTELCGICLTHLEYKPLSFLQAEKIRKKKHEYKKA